MHHCVSKDKGNFFWNYPKLSTQKILPWHIDYAIYRQPQSAHCDKLMTIISQTKLTVHAARGLYVSLFDQ